GGALLGEGGARGLRRVNGEEILDAHHAAVRRHVARVTRRHALHRLERTPGVAVGAGLPGGAPGPPALPGRPRAGDPGSVRPFAGVAEAHGPGARLRIALGVLRWRTGAPLGVEERHEVDDILGGEDPRRAPWWHDRLWIEVARVVDHVERVLWREPAVAVG